MVKRKKSALWRDWTSILLQEGPQGVLCIRKAGHAYWEFPGGKRHANDRRPEVTVLRENREETHVRLVFSHLAFVGSTQQFNHRTHEPWELYFYRAKLTEAELASHKGLSREGEEVGIFTWTQLNQMKEFSPFHRHLAEMHGVWRTK